MASESDRPVSASTTISTVTAFTSISVTTANDANLAQQPAARFHNHDVATQALRPPPPPPIQKNTTFTVPPFYGPSSSKLATRSGISGKSTGFMSGSTLAKPQQLLMSDSLGEATVPKQNVVFTPITSRSLATRNSGTAAPLSSSKVAEPNCATDCSVEAHREIWEEARLELGVTETALRQAKAAHDVADRDEMIMFKAYSEARLKPHSHPSLPRDATTAKTINKQQQRQDASVGSRPPTMWTFPATTSPSSYFPSFVEVLPFSLPLASDYPGGALNKWHQIVCMTAYAMWSPQELRVIYYQQIEKYKERTDAWSTAMAQSRARPTRPRLAWEKPSRLTKSWKDRSATAIITPEENLQPIGKAIWEEAAWETARSVARLRRSAQLQAEVTYQAAFLDEQIKFRTYSDIRHKANMCYTMGFGS